ncbi:dihydrolipoyl dehydrogenase [Salinicoccus hispanicus]|uniref:Dihydrolipoyl dehydrogenase n=1 Tax=Salinicoccus hispanicus TaxID=157225 RepID=A0A6N8TXP7_9STAP|nr:dihydrolipoyl dehydrogenase [Salinicoccus hispanicus]MXQ50232.1 dihydrolipoyl dehydrogenase [Salinicoccus hispanicus]
MAYEYDLVILGGGTAGYVAAIKASQLGLKTAIVEKENLGGTCLHKGCIPTKSMLKSAEVAYSMRNADLYGIGSVTPEIDMSKIQGRKQEVVDRMHGGVKHLMKKYKVDIFNGHGRILGPSIFSPMAGTVAVEHPEDEEAESEILINQHVLIATGSHPRPLPFLPFDHEVVLSSDDMMTLDHIPSRMAIIGGGVIGLEFASMLTDLGAEVTVIEAGNHIIPHEDKDIAAQLKKSLEARGITFKIGSALDESRIDKQEQSITLKMDDGEASFDKVLVAIGRAPNTDDLGLANTKIKLDKGYIETNVHYQTGDAHIYAVGDVIGNLQLAHVATKEAIAAVEHMADENPLPLDYNGVPRCIYTSPEVAAIGMTEEGLKQQNIDYSAHKVPFAAVGKAVISHGDKGFGKILVDPGTKDILGLSLIGPGATELINEAALAKFLDASALELGSAIHAHPSIGEVLMELGLDAEDKGIHV